MSEKVKSDGSVTRPTTEPDPPGGGPGSPKCAAIVCAAADLFLHSGYGEVSMDAIAAKAGVSKRTVYSHFSGKDELFAAVMGTHCDQVIGQDSLKLDPAEEPREVLCRLGTHFLSLVTSPPAVALFRTVVAEAERFPELGKAYFASGPQRWLATVVPYLEELDRQGRLRVPDPASSASTLLYMFKDPLHMRCILGVQQSVSEVEIRDHVAAAVDRFLELHRPA
jgi:TetR/AcrR family transcriptional regulator, mexJK operon transcriptional repressor